MKIGDKVKVTDPHFEGATGVIVEMMSSGVHTGGHIVHVQVDLGEEMYVLYVLHSSDKGYVFECACPIRDLYYIKEEVK